jgi:hypothetical protein
MVADKVFLVREFVASEDYCRLVRELIFILKITVDDSYEDFFAKLDVDKLERAELSLNDVAQTLQMEHEQIMRYSINKFNELRGTAEIQDYPAGGEPPEDEKDVILSEDGYSRGFLLGNIIEYCLSKKGSDRVFAYVKSSRIPKAKQYATQIMGFLK